MKRRFCILLAAVMLVFTLTSLTNVKAATDDFHVSVANLKEALAHMEDSLHWESITYSRLLDRIQSGQEPDLLITPDETLVNDLETMPPFTRELIRKYLVTEDGQFWGCADYFDLKAMLFYVPDAWADSPFRDRTPPTSFEDFLDFAELYLDTPHEGFCLLSAAANRPLAGAGKYRELHLLSIL